MSAMPKLSAGREADALVGEHVMGLTVHRDWPAGPYPDGGGWCVPDHADGTSDDGEGGRYEPGCADERHPVYDVVTSDGASLAYRDVVPFYSTDTDHAMLVLDAWPHDWTLSRDAGRFECALFDPAKPEGISAVARADTAALAICRAALAASGLARADDAAMEYDL